MQELEDIMYLCMLARAYSTDSRLQDVLGRAVRGPPGQRYQFTRKPIQLNNIQLVSQTITDLPILNLCSFLGCG